MRSIGIVMEAKKKKLGQTSGDNRSLWGHKKLNMTEQQTGKSNPSLIT